MDTVPQSWRMGSGLKATINGEDEQDTQEESTKATQSAPWVSFIVTETCFFGDERSNPHARSSLFLKRRFLKLEQTSELESLSFLRDTH